MASNFGRKTRSASTSLLKMTRAVVIGAGLSGIATALMLQRCGVSDVTVLEKRAGHSRDNQILLNHVGVSRLQQLGVYKAWQEMYHHQDGAVSEGAVTRGNGIEDLVREMKENGRLPANAPEDHIRFQFDTTVDTVIRACKELGLEVNDTTGVVTNFGNASPEVIAGLQQRGLGIENVKIQELEQTMVKLCEERCVKIVYNCGDVQLVLSPSKDTVVEVRAGNDVRIRSPNLVVDCEGARRSIAKQQLKLREVRSTKSQWFVNFVVDKYFGPLTYTVINARDSDHPSARLRHFIVGNFQTKQHSLCALQLPPQFVGKLDDDYNGEMLKQYCRKHLQMLSTVHGLEAPPEVFAIKWEPFESREMYIEAPGFGNNVVVIGDAARSGTFLSGIAFNLALVCDLNVIETLALQIVRDGQASQEMVASVGASIERTSKFFHQFNLDRYY